MCRYECIGLKKIDDEGREREKKKKEERERKEGISGPFYTPFSREGMKTGMAHVSVSVLRVSELLLLLIFSHCWYRAFFFFFFQASRKKMKQSRLRPNSMTIEIKTLHKRAWACGHGQYDNSKESMAELLWNWFFGQLEKHLEDLPKLIFIIRQCKSCNESNHHRESAH